MGIIVNLYLWMFPLLLIFQSALSSQKRQYVSENSELNQPLNYELADDYRVKTGFALLLLSRCASRPGIRRPLETLL